MPNRDNLGSDTDLNPNIQSFIPEGELNASVDMGSVSHSSNSPLAPNLQPHVEFSFFRENIYTHYYTLSDSVRIEGRIQDPDGFDDLDRLELRALYRDSYETRVFDLPTITQFTPDPNDGATFDYNFDLKQLPLDEGNHHLTLEVIAYDRAGNGSRLRQNFYVNNALPSLTINFNPWQSSHIITFDDARVEDGDGLQDLDYIDFKLRDGNRFIDVADVTEFIGNFPDSPYGTFDYTLDLSRLNLPNDVSDWVLVGNLYDKAGNIAYWESPSLQIPREAPQFFFDLANNDYFNSYSSHETLSLERTHIASVSYVEDIDRIDFQLVLGRGFDAKIIDVPDVTEFQHNPNRPYEDFTYDLDLSSLNLSLGSYEATLKGILYDVWGNHSEQSRSFYIGNHAPSFSFDLDDWQYSFGDTLTLTNTRISDEDGLVDLDRIDFQVYDVKNNRTIDVADAVNFNDFTFDYSLDLKTLDLAPGPAYKYNPYRDYNSYDLVLQGIAYDKAGNRSELLDRDFSLTNSFPEQFQFDLDRTAYSAGETLTITGGQVKDGDGFEDIDRIDFRLGFSDGTSDLFIDLPDVTTFNPDLYDNDLAYFDYSFTLDNLPIPQGRYWMNLEAIAYDRVGNSSQLQARAFDFDNRSGQWNDNIPALSFQLDRSEYVAGETLTLEEAWVENENGLDRLDRIDFYLQLDSDRVIDVADVTQFNPDPNHSHRATFDYSLDLKNLGLTDYHFYSFQLIGIAYETSGLGSAKQAARLQVTNNIPDFDFGIVERYYDFGGRVLTLTNTWVEDFDRLSNLDRIDFSATIDNGSRVYKFIDLPDVTTFIPDSNNENRGTFDLYNIPLSTLGLEPGYANIKIEATLYDRTGNQTSHYDSIYIYRYAPQGTATLDNETHHYAAGDILTLKDARVEDVDGFSDLDRIEFEAIINYGNNEQKIIDLPDVTTFIPDPDNSLEGTFDYSLDLGTLGIPQRGHFSVELVGTIYDKLGYQNDLFLPNFYVSNEIPQFNFSVENWEYTTGETLILTDTWVEDRNGLDNLDRIDFGATINSTEYIDLPDVTTFIPDTENSDRGTFHYALDLATLGLNGGTHSIHLSGALLDKAGNIGYGSGYNSFHVTNPLPEVSFNLERDRYSFSDTLTITEGTVESWRQNFNGFNDVDRVDLRLRIDHYSFGNERIIDIADITDFTIDADEPRKATFNYTLDFASLGLELGNYTLEIETLTYDKGEHGVIGESQTIRLTNTIPSLDFQLSQSEYRAEDTLTVTEARVEDPDGFTNLDRVDFLLRNLDNDTAIDVTDVTDLIADANNFQQGTFNYSLNFADWGLNSGHYQLEGIAYDQQNNSSSLATQLFTILPPENTPQNLVFSLDDTTYIPNASISLKNGWVKDEDGGDDITRIDLRLWDASDNLIAEIEDITNFAIASWNPHWTSFATQIDLSSLNLSEGTYTLSAMAYDTNNNTSNAFERDFYLEAQQNQFNPNNLQFSLDKNTYNASDTLQIRNGWISDEDGANDINRVEFKLVSHSGTEIFLVSVDRFTQASWSPKWSSFDRRFDLSQFTLNEGEYTLIGIAYDDAGQQSNSFERRFSLESPQVNNDSPTRLQFRLNGNRFSAHDTLEITNGWVSDRDGNEDLEGVTFEIIAEDGTIIDAIETSNLTAATWDKKQQWSSFYHSVDLSALGLSGGRYTLRGKAYDRAGNYSNSFSRMFAIA